MTAHATSPTPQPSTSSSTSASSAASLADKPLIVGLREEGDARKAAEICRAWSDEVERLPKEATEADYQALVARCPAVQPLWGVEGYGGHDDEIGRARGGKGEGLGGR